MFYSISQVLKFFLGQDAREDMEDDDFDNDETKVIRFAGISSVLRVFQRQACVGFCSNMEDDDFDKDENKGGLPYQQLYITSFSMSSKSIFVIALTKPWIASTVLHNSFFLGIFVSCRWLPPRNQGIRRASKTLHNLNATWIIRGF